MAEEPNTETRPIRVFISYSWDSPAHMDRVLDLSDRLRREGMDAWLDQYEVSPEEGWPRWMKRQIRRADFVLVVATETYCRRFDGEEAPRRGLGATWEGAILTQELYDEGTRNTRFIPVAFTQHDAEHIPTELRGGTRYILEAEQTYQGLYRHLTGQAATPAPPIGKLRSCPPLERRTSFLGESKPPEASHADAEGRRLSERRSELEQQLEDLRLAGRDTLAVQTNLSFVKRQIRRGGQLSPNDELGYRRYRLLEVLGTGGFASVWKAWDRTLYREVAIKVLHGQHAYDPSLQQRFLRGARQMAALSHPHIAEVLNKGFEEDGYYAYVMEYLSGGDLNSALLSARVSKTEALRAFFKAASGIQYAHKKQVIHRDIKPENILLDGNGAAKITDFDLVRVNTESATTQTNARLGTIVYSAPECLENAKAATQSADIYSLAMTLCFILHGAEIPIHTLADPRKFIQNLSCNEQTRAALKKATSRNPEDRQASVEEFLHDLGHKEPEPEILQSSRIDGAPEKPLNFHYLITYLESIFEKGNDFPAATAPWMSGVQEHKDLLLHIPALAGSGRLACTTIDRLRSLTRNGNALFFLYEALNLVPLLYPESTNLSKAHQLRFFDHMPNADPAIVQLKSIPAGEVEIGTDPKDYGEADERPPFIHSIEREFLLSSTPVTERAYAAFDPKKPRLSQSRNEPLSGDLPRTMVTWFEAVSFCRWLNRVIPFVRLPTELEWEFACKTGLPKNSSIRETASALKEQAWYSSNSNETLQPVGMKAPNKWGLHDMLGNIWEWTNTRKTSHPYPWHQIIKRYSSEESKSNIRAIVRGASYLSAETNVRPEFRSHSLVGDRWKDLGFRILKEGSDGRLNEQDQLQQE